MSKRKASPPPGAPDAHEVGYRRPPVAHRFKPGQSGNPSGRTKGVRNLKSDLAEELAETILVQEGGVAARLTKQRALVKRLSTGALSGDPRAIAQLVQLMLRLFPPEASADHDEHLSETDRAILARVLARSGGAVSERKKR